MSFPKHSVRSGAIIAAFAGCVALAGCSGLQLHSAQDYQKATALGTPDGSLTTIVGPNTAIVDLTGLMQFPQGDAGPVHSVLVYDRPGGSGGTCIFHSEYANRYRVVTKRPQVTQPCDGKGLAQFHIGGIDAAFVAHLHNMNYKGTPVTLLEIGKYEVPEYVRVMY